MSIPHTSFADLADALSDLSYNLTKNPHGFVVTHEKMTFEFDNLSEVQAFFNGVEHAASL